VEEAWELAAVSEKMALGDRYNWTAKHTRLKFQMVVSSLVFYLCKEYQLTELNFLGAFKFKEIQSQTQIVFGVFLFAIFSLLCFMTRTFYEKPEVNTKLNEYLLSYKIYVKSVKELKNNFNKSLTNENLSSVFHQALKLAANESIENRLSDSDLFAIKKSVLGPVERLKHEGWKLNSDPDLLKSIPKRYLAETATAFYHGNELDQFEIDFDDFIVLQTSLETKPEVLSFLGKRAPDETVLENFIESRIVSAKRAFSNHYRLSLRKLWGNRIDRLGYFLELYFLTVIVPR